MQQQYKTPNIIEINKPFYDFVNATDTVNGYLKKVSELIKHEYCLGRISIYRYEEIINNITCAQLEVESINKTARRKADINLRNLVNKDLNKKQLIDVSI